MLFETLKLRMRVEQRIFVIETSYVAYVQNPILHSVDPAAAVGLRVRRKPKRMRHTSGGIAIIRQLPKLLNANAINLWFASGIEAEALNQLLRERPSWPF